ncbi:hypothetical protein NDA01_30820 [Trichocoleus desertorum AS-A10]|uniref:hypothetical protein n=1 Tax=Trichocoleus desertorum TaxID=1481672 RepID=UPI003296AEDE
MAQRRHFSGILRVLGTADSVSSERERIRFGEVEAIAQNESVKRPSDRTPVQLAIALVLRL